MASDSGSLKHRWLGIVFAFPPLIVFLRLVFAALCAVSVPCLAGGPEVRPRVGSEQLRAASKQRLRVGMVRCNTSTGRVTPRALARFRETLQRHPELDLLLAPEWFLVANDRLYNAHELRAIRRHLQRQSAGRKTLILPGTVAWAKNGKYRNTALALADGKLLKSYAKQVDGTDGWYGHAHGCKWVPGRRDGVFHWRGLKVGVEICADHYSLPILAASPSLGTLRSTARDLDLQIVLSCSMNLYPEASAVRPGGYMLLCDGHDQTAQVVKQRTGGDRYIDIPPASGTAGQRPTRTSGPFELVTFELPMGLGHF
jgi:predicted amidohydrolase